MKRPLAYIFQTLFQHEIFVIIYANTERMQARVAVIVML
jgi:hypothetical protein